jgi:glycine cleavage system H protein
MSRNRWLNRSVILGTSLVVLLVCLPLFAVMTVVGRVILLALFVVTVAGGTLLFAFNSRFREWVNVQICPVIEHKGLRMGTDVALDRGHAWARLQTRRVLVGADDLMQAALGPIDTIELPARGAEVRRGEPLFVLRRGDRSVEVKAPLSGTVTATNSRVRERPGLVNEEPFGEGWAVMLRGRDVDAETSRLLSGRKAQEWFREEVDRLIALILAEPTSAPGLADGGAIVDGLYQHVDGPAWRRLQEAFFTSSDERGAQN